MTSKNIPFTCCSFYFFHILRCRADGCVQTREYLLALLIPRILLNSSFIRPTNGHLTHKI